MARVTEPCKGWIIPDQAIKFENLSVTDSSYTQAGPHGGGSGVPVDTSTQAAIEVSGDQDTSIVVRVENGGLPRLAANGVRLGYRKSSEATTTERGWECPNVLTGAGNAPVYSTSVRDSMDLIALRDGTLFCCYRTSTTLSMASYNPDTAAWTDLASYLPDTGTWSQGMALAQDTDGRLIFIGKNNTSGTWNVYRSVLVDSALGGWTCIANNVLTSAAGSADKMRLFIMPNGDWSLWQLTLSGTDLLITQHASDSRGASFTSIGSITAGSYTYLGDVVMTATGKIALVASDNAATDPYFVAVGSPWEPMGVSATGVVITTTNTTHDCWAASDPNGRIYIWTREGTARSKVRCGYSDDDGATWTMSTYSLMSAGATADTDPYLTFGKAVHCGGSFYLMAKGVDTGVPRNFIFTKMGGYSNVIARQLSTSTSKDAARFGSGGADIAGQSWVATSLPLAQGCWTNPGAAGTETLTTPGQLVIVNTGTNTQYYASSVVPGNNNILGGASFACQAGGTTLTSKPGVDMIWSDGAQGIQLKICANTTSFVVRNNTSSLASVTVDMTVAMQFKWMILPDGDGTSTVEVYYKRPYSETWLLAYGSSSVGYAALVTSQMFWGHIGATNSGTTSAWDYVWFATTATDGFWASPLSSNATAAAASSMIGRLTSSLPAPIGLRAASGQKVAYVRLTDGPGYVGDSWTVPPKYDHGVENLHWARQPSPRRTWRSTQVASDENIAWETASSVTTTLGRFLGISLMNVNFPTAYLQGNLGAGWVTLATYNGKVDFTSLEWSRTAGSDRITVNSTSSTAARWIQPEELVGATVSLGGGKYRKIRAHTEGSWGTDAAAAGRTVELWLDGVDDSEGTSGSLDIWARNGVVFVHPTTTNHYRRYRLNIPAQANADGYFEIGTLIIGSLYVPGQQHTWNSTASYGSNASMSESSDGVTRVRERGPVRRTWTWDWSDAVDISRIRDTANPDYITPDSMSYSDGVATYQDAPFKIAALLKKCKSGQIPVVAVASIPTLASTTSVTQTDPTLFLYGRVSGDISLEMVIGNEGVDEVLRGGSFPVVEIV